MLNTEDVYKRQTESVLLFANDFINTEDIMDWIKVSIFTTSEGIEPLSGRLYQLGICLLYTSETENFLSVLTTLEKMFRLRMMNILML